MTGFFIAIADMTPSLIRQLDCRLIGALHHKPRTYRQLARKAYLTIAKKRHPSRKLIRDS